MTTRMGAARSTEVDGHVAGTRAAAEALSSVGDLPCQLIVAFVSPKYDMRAVLAGISGQTGTTPIIGCSSYGEFTGAGSGKGSVAVAAIASDRMRVNVGVGRGISGGGLAGLVEASIASFDATTSNGRDDLQGRTLILFTDGIMGGTEPLVNELMTRTQMRYQLFGGAAADNIEFKETFVFHDNEVITDAFVCAEILSERPFGVALSHGWTALSEPMRVTSSDGAILRELNGEPAWDVYKAFAAEHGIAIPQGGERGFLMKHLLGLDLESAVGSKLRVPLIIHDDGSITCVGEIPEGAIVRIMTVDAADVVENGKNAIARAAKRMGGQGVAGVLALECTAMQLNLGDDLTRIVENTAAASQPALLAGCASYGQLARIQGGFEGLTDASSLVCLIPA